MTQGFCTDKGALIAYLYDDCEPGERDRIAAHVADCAECTAELAALTATRSQLAAWVLPHAALGFQVDPAQLAESLRSSPPLTPIDSGVSEVGTAEAWRGVPAASWWRQPLPAWAQAAAAVLIFAAGVGFSNGRSATVPDRATAQPTDSPISQGVSVTPVSATDAPTVAPEELARLEQKLQAMQDEIAALRAAGRAAPPTGEDAVTLAQVANVVATSKKELLQQMVWRDAAWNKVREDDMRLIEGLVGPLRAQVPADRMPSSYGPAYGLQMRPTNISLPR